MQWARREVHKPRRGCSHSQGNANSIISPLIGKMVDTQGFAAACPEF